MPPDWQWGRHALPDRGLASPYSLCHRLEHTESGPKPRFSGGAPRDGRPPRLGRRPPEGAPTRRRGRRKLSGDVGGGGGHHTRRRRSLCIHNARVPWNARSRDRSAHFDTDVDVFPHPEGPAISKPSPRGQSAGPGGTGGERCRRQGQAGSCWTRSRCLVRRRPPLKTAHRAGEPGPGPELEAPGTPDGQRP